MAFSQALKSLWFTGIVFLILPQFNLGQLSDYKICGDSECESKSKSYLYKILFFNINIYMAFIYVIFFYHTISFLLMNAFRTSFHSLFHSLF